jgi:glycosyltransferase involved in cell wall biosynthesis
MKKLAVVVPAYNEQRNVSGVIERFAAIRPSLEACGALPLLVIVDDGSRDGTFRRFVSEISKADIPATVIRLVRNFGKDNAVMAALQRVEADLYVIVDADGQTPLALVPDMIARLGDGPVEIVNGVKDREPYGPFRMAATALFFWIVRLLGINEIRKGASDFLLFTRRVRDELVRLKECELVVRNMIHWLGFPEGDVSFTPSKVSSSAFTFRKLFLLAIKGIISFSGVLRINFFLAFLYWTFSFGYGALILYNKFTGRIVVGLSTMTLLTLISFGLLFFMIAVIGEYLMALFDEIKNRPSYLVEEVWESGPRQITSPPVK